MTNEAKIDEILSRGVAEAISADHLRERLLSGEKLRIKLGIDPTSPNIHLGRAVVLLKLRDLQELGHEVYLIIGDFTGQIGDTSDKESERPMLSREAVEHNMLTYLHQVYKLLIPEKTKIFHNSTWLSGLTLREVGDLADWFSLSEFMSRENIKKRFEEGKRISLRELLYPLMQGYDSVMIDSDLELGGTDQRFNMLAGREIQRHYVPNDDELEAVEENIKSAPRRRRGILQGEAGHSYDGPQDVMMLNIILGTDGRKMSSSWGNTINLTDEPNDMLGKVMSIPDDLITSYFIHCTRVDMKEVERMAEDIVTGMLNPRDAKLRLAKEIVKMYHSEEAAQEAEKYFIATFSKREIPEDIEELRISEGASLVQAIAEAGLAASKGDAKRKIEQGGVEIDGEKITDWNYVVTAKDSHKTLKVGKKDFRKIIVC